MSLPSVQTIQRLALPPGAALVAGARGLSRGVSWPATLRTRAPGFASLKSGEFLLIATSTLSLLDPNLSLVKLLQGVARVGISGAAILGQIPQDCRAWADSQEIPIYSLPSTTHLPDLELAIARAIADARTEFDRRSHDIYRQLAQLAIEERGIAAIVEELSRLTAKVAHFLDQGFGLSESFPSFESQYLINDLSRVRPEVIAWTRKAPMSASEPPVKHVTLNERDDLLLAPVLTREGVAGYLAVTAERGSFDELDDAAVAGAAAAAAIELSRERAVFAAQERVQASVFEELVSGTTPLSDALRRRAARLDFDLSADHTVSVTSVRGAEIPSGPLEIYLREARATVGALHSGVIGGMLVVVLTNWDRRQLAAIEALRESLARRIGSDATTGIGRRLPGLEGVRQSYRDAVEALQLARESPNPSRTTLYADLGLDRLLLTFRGHPDLRRFYDETMDRLALGDGKGDGESIRTLEAYFASNGSPTEAATRLHLHRNTLLYRLQRIRTLTEVDLDDPEVRLALQVALRVRRVLEMSEAVS